MMREQLRVADGVDAALPQPLARTIWSGHARA